MEKVLIIISLSLFLGTIFLFIENYKLNKKVKWFEDWGRKYVEKYRDEARRDGLTK